MGPPLRGKRLYTAKLTFTGKRIQVWLYIDQQVPKLENDQSKRVYRLEQEPDITCGADYDRNQNLPCASKTYYQ